MNFVEHIFANLRHAAGRPLLQEVRGDSMVSCTGSELLALIQAARTFLRQASVKKGDRCVLLAPNSIRWAAVDLAILAEGGIAVPLYSRQAPHELAAMMKDSAPALMICSDTTLHASIQQAWPGAPRSYVLDEILPASSAAAAVQEDAQPSAPIADSDAVAIIYTSGTSGEPKGVVLTVANLDFMLQCTTERLDILMQQHAGPEQVFHYAPFCFAASWILLLSCLSRDSVLTLSTDLSKLADEMRLAAPDYFLNVPILLERVRAKIEENLQRRGGFAFRSFSQGRRAWLRRNAGEGLGLADKFWLAFAQSVVFPAIRKNLGSNLKALICGSAPLSVETQLFFMMLGLPVLQVYGLTETTAICTMDHPDSLKPGFVGKAIEGVDMKLGDADEILVRGPNLFLGYWNRPDATRDAMRDGWFHTGDQGEVTADGYWRITGRIKNLIVLSSGHNVAPEPIEEKILRTVAGAQQAVIVGNGRGFLSAVITGDLTDSAVQKALDSINTDLPHYKRVHAFCVEAEPFSINNGLLTINGKMKRDAIAARYHDRIEALYQKRSA